MSKGKQLEKLMNRDDRLHKRFSALFYLYDSLDNKHPDKSRIYARMMQVNDLMDTNTKLMTDLLKGDPAEIETVVKDVIRSEKISKGTIEGMQRAKEAGKHIGRPSEDNADILAKYPNVIECINKGLSLRNTAKACGVSVNTVRKVKALLEADNTDTKVKRICPNCGRKIQDKNALLCYECDTTGEPY